MQEQQNFLQAVARDDIVTVQQIVQETPQLVNCQSKTGLTALHICASEGFAQMCKLLLQVPQIDANVQDDRGCTAMHMLLDDALEGGDTLEMFNMLEGVTDFGISTWKAYLPLHVAAENTVNEKVIEQVIKRTPNINAKILDGSTAFHLACQSANLAAVQCLVRANCDIYMRCNEVWMQYQVYLHD